MCKPDRGRGRVWRRLVSQTQQPHRCFSTWGYFSPFSLSFSVSVALGGSTKAQQVAGSSPIDFDFPFSLNVYAIAVKAQTHSQYPFSHSPLSHPRFFLHLFCLPNPINAGDFHYNNATNLQHHCKLIDFYVQRVFLFPLSEIANTLWQQQQQQEMPKRQRVRESVKERERESSTAAWQSGKWLNCRPAVICCDAIWWQDCEASRAFVSWRPLSKIHLKRIRNLWCETSLRYQPYSNSRGF